MERASRIAQVLVLSTILGLSMNLQGLALAEGSSQGTKPLSQKHIRSEKPEQKIAAPSAKKPHRLIRRPTISSATTPAAATAEAGSSTSSIVIPSPPPTKPQENSSVQPKDPAVSKGVQLPVFLAPLSSTFVGQIQPTPTVVAPETLTGNITSSTRMAAATPEPSTPSAPPSMRRLFAEIPGTTEILAYEEPDPVVSTPTLLRNPTAMSFSAVQNSAPPATQTLTISNGGSGNLTWSASSNSAWLTLNGTSFIAGSTPGTLNVAVNPAGLSVGPHNGIITIVGTGAANSPQSVAVTFDITAGPTPTIGLSATALSFSATRGGANPTNKTVSVSNSGGGTLNWTATENANWLSLSPGSGTGTGTITLSVNTTGMAPGTYSAPITVTATGATNTPQTIAISLTVTAPPTIGFTPTAMTFTATQGGANPGSQTLSISNTGGGTLNWTLSDNAAWLISNPSTGTGAGSSNISISTTGLTAGTYNATITISAPGATAVTVPVTLAIGAAASLTTGPSSLSYAATQGGPNPTSQTITVTSNTSWTVTKNASWLTVSPTSGTNNGSITVGINTAIATIGANSGTVTIAGGGVTRTVNVTLTLNAAATSSATLTWTANTESDVAGYNIYRSTTSGIYGSPIATLQGTVTSYVATGLQPGTTYFFVLTAYDNAGNESVFSNEVSKSIF